MESNRITIPQELYEWFEAEALNLGIPVRELIERALEEFSTSVIEHFEKTLAEAGKK